MRVLFLDSVHPVLETDLTSEGWICDHDYTSSYSDILQKIGHYGGVVIRSRIPIDSPFLNAARQLKFIARSGAGLENIDTALAQEKGVAVFHSPEGNRKAVAEHVLGLTLALINNFGAGDKQVRAGEWNREANRGMELSEITLGIIGFGFMGQETAELFQKLGVRVLAHDKYKVGFATPGIQEVQLDTIVQEADVISLHLPENKETKGYVGSEFIKSLKKPVYLINTARGKHVVLQDLLEGLKSGKIRGAGLDVLELESKSFSQIEKNPAMDALRKREDVIFTPHVAGWTQLSYVKLSKVLSDKILERFGARKGS